MKPSSFRLFFIKLRNWEYWPIYVVYFPVYLYWLFCSIRTRSFFYFVAANPGIKNGGMLGESKFEILDKIEEKPKTLLIKAYTPIAEVVQVIATAGISFPFIAKPNIGERGWKVKKITNLQVLENYLRHTPVDFLIQEYLDLPVEAGVFYIRHPKESKGYISSIVIKDMLKVTGDGSSTLLTLIKKYDRAYLQLKNLSENPSLDLNRIPSNGESVLLNSIGNHCLGTIFLNGNYLISPEMEEAFDKISSEIPGFYYGRFDLRAASLEDLKKGNIKVMELNGAGAEPAHIYQPGYPLYKGLYDLYNHFREMYKISRANIQAGCKLPTFKEGWKEVQKIKEYNRKYKVG